MPRIRIKPQVRQPQAARARFERKFVNGVWTIFDHHKFGHGLPIGTVKEAARIERDLNEGRRQWAA